MWTGEARGELVRGASPAPRGLFPRFPRSSPPFPSYLFFSLFLFLLCLCVFWRRTLAWLQVKREEGPEVL